jgi:hypothetical protein
MGAKFWHECVSFSLTDSGFFTSSVLYAYFLALPVLFLGTACGASGFKRINQAQYVLLINAILAILGVISLIKGVL